LASQSTHPLATVIGSLPAAEPNLIQAHVPALNKHFATASVMSIIW